MRGSRHLTKFPKEQLVKLLVFDQSFVRDTGVIHQNFLYASASSRGFSINIGVSRVVSETEGTNWHNAPNDVFVLRRKRQVFTLRDLLPPSFVDCGRFVFRCPRRLAVRIGDPNGLRACATGDHKYDAYEPFCQGHRPSSRRRIIATRSQSVSLDSSDRRCAMPLSSIAACINSW